MRTIPEDEKVFLGGDFNGHIGRDAGCNRPFFLILNILTIQ